jgi:hypothetical protein
MSWCPLLPKNKTIHVQPNMPFQHPCVKGKIILFLLDKLDGSIGQKILLALLDRLDKSGRWLCRIKTNEA